MAAIPRDPSTGAPSVDTVAEPVYASSSPYGRLTTRQRWTVALRSPLTTGRGTFTGTIAIPRAQAGQPLTAAQEAAAHQAALLGAAQRAQRAGLPASSVPLLAASFEGRGFFPDFAALEAGSGFGGVMVDPSTMAPVDFSGGGGAGGSMGELFGPESAGGPLGGGSPSWIVLGLLGLGLVLLLSRSGGRRGR
jgi:hypothetical protein